MGNARKKRTRPPQSQGSASRSDVVKRSRAALASFLPVIAIFLGTRVAVAEAYRIPSGSMEPTLQVGDWLFVNKLRLGPHIPFTRISLPGYASPHRFDVVVFESPPQDPEIRISPDEVTPTLVKRIVGMPGDTLIMRHGQLTVNGSSARSYNRDYVLPDSVADQPNALFAWQHRLEIHGSRFGDPISAPSLHEWGPLVVPANMLFMVGDNRDNSVDSRYYGPVPRKNIRGTPMFVYYSYDPERGLDYFRALTDIRWRRIGTWIR
jgi:signal peptidase I